MEAPLLEQGMRECEAKDAQEVDIHIYLYILTGVLVMDTRCRRLRLSNGKHKTGSPSLGPTS